MLKSLLIINIVLSSSIIALAESYPSKYSRCEGQIPSVRGLYEKSNDKNEKYLASIDAGLEYSTDCNTVFVKPPRRGRVEFIDPHFHGQYYLCPALTIRQHAIKRLLKKSMNPNISADEYALIDSQLSLIKNELHEKGAKDPGIFSNVTYDTAWDELLESYKEINQNNNLNKQVKKLPVFSLYLVSNIKEDQFAMSKDFPHIYRSSINGLTLINSNDNIVLTNGQSIASDFTSFLFGSSLSGSLQLALLYSCPTPEEIDDKNLMYKKLATGIQSSLYYFYYSYSPKSYEIRIERDAFKTGFKSALTQNYLKVSDMQNMIKKFTEQNIISVRIVNNETGEAISQAKALEDVQELIANTILSQANSVSGQPENSDSFAKFASSNIDATLDNIASFVEKKIVTEDLVVNYDSIAFEIHGDKK